MEKQIHNALEKAWIDVITEKFKSDDWDILIKLLQEILDRLKNFVPNRKDLHERMDASLPCDLIKQMIDHKAIEEADFRNYFSVLLNWVKEFGAPEDDKTVDLTLEKINNISIKSYAETCPPVLLEINKHVNTIEKRLIKIRKRHIVLIGFPGVGKSTISQRLSKFERIELDDIIERKHDMKLQDIIRDKGESYLKNIERSELENAIDKMEQSKSSCVLSPGGSVIYHRDLFERLSKIAVIIFLKTDFNILKQRTNDFSNRGVCFNDMSLDDWHQHRQILYNNFCDISIDIDNDNVSSTVNNINQKIQQWISE